MAVNQTGIKRVAIAGGVSANSEVRKRLKEMESHAGWEVFIPDFQYTTDNAAMIGIAGYLKYQAGMFDPLDSVGNARMTITDI